MSDHNHAGDEQQVLRRWTRQLAPDSLPTFEELIVGAFADGLTDLPNRSWACDRLRAFERTGQAGTVAIIDIDHFKLINGRHGHRVGDRLLRTWARRILDVIPENCMLARFGGDEFLLFVPEAGTEAALELVAACQRVLALPTEVGGLSVNGVTFSAGLAPFPGAGLDATLRTCDSLIHAAKESGRGRIITSPDSAPPVVIERRRLAKAVLDLQGQVIHLWEENRSDPGTGLRNRRALDEVLDRPSTLAPGARSGVVLAFIDIDHFGDFNHHHGDDRGDEVLREVAQALQASASRRELVFRKGGEEFVVVLPDQSPQTAAAWGERLRAAVQDLAIAHPASPTAPVVTVTVGVAAADRLGALRPLLHAASSQVMAAKVSQSRNAVHVAALAQGDSHTSPSR